MEKEKDMIGKIIGNNKEYYISSNIVILGRGEHLNFSEEQKGSIYYLIFFHFRIYGKKIKYWQFSQ